MLVGGYGPNAPEVVERVARRSELELSRVGRFAVAAPRGSIASADAGDVRLWLSGRTDIGGLPEPLRPPGTPEVQVLANAFDRLGSGVQADVHGEYLVVTLERRKGLVRVSHDHLGARTLNFTRRSADTFFAEHIVDILALLAATPAPDRLALVEWINRRTLPFRRSLFSGIARLGPGEALQIAADGNVAITSFWRPTYVEPPPLSVADSAAAITAAAYAAIGRAGANVRRPAVKLSGGLDSACVAAGLAATSNGRRPMAFSATFGDYPETDESDLIEQTAGIAGLELVKVPHRDAPIIDGALAWVRRWMLPPSSPNHPFWWRLVDAARARGIDGLFDGEGGDEMFSAAPYLIADRLRTGHLFSAWSLAGRLPGLGPHPSALLRLKALRVYGVSGAMPRPAQRLRRRFRNQRVGIDPLILDSDVPALLAQDETWGWKDGDGPLWWRSAVALMVDAGQRLDFNGELAREEVEARIPRRHPFLHDARLVEAVLQVPPQHQFDSVRDRPLLRDGLRGAIPEQVRTRHEKSYFDELITRPLSGPDSQGLVTKLLSSTSPVGNYVRRDGLEELSMIPSAQGRQRHLLIQRLFCLVCVDEWLRCLEDGPTSANHS